MCAQEDKLAEQERLRKQEEEQFFREEELRELGGLGHLAKTFR